MSKIIIDKKDLLVNRKKIEFPYEIEKAETFNNYIIILLDKNTYKQTVGQFHNLYIYDISKNIKLEVELPTSNGGDCYYDFHIKKESLNAYSVYSFDCLIDFKTGKILEKEFYK